MQQINPNAKGWGSQLGVLYKRKNIWHQILKHQKVQFKKVKILVWEMVHFALVNTL